MKKIQFRKLQLVVSPVLKRATGENFNYLWRFSRGKTVEIYLENWRSFLQAWIPRNYYYYYYYILIITNTSFIKLIQIIFKFYMIYSYKQISTRRNRKIDKSVLRLGFDSRESFPTNFERSISHDYERDSRLETRFRSTNDLEDRPICLPSELIKISRCTLSTYHGSRWLDFVLSPFLSSCHNQLIPAPVVIG